MTLLVDVVVVNNEAHTEKSQERRYVDKLRYLIL